MNQPISLDELRVELERLGVGGSDDEGLSVNEWAELWGCSRDTTRSRLQQAKQHGLLIVGKKRIRQLDGNMCLRPCYKINLGGKKKRK